jgi:hypothetical protein
MSRLLLAVCLFYFSLIGVNANIIGHLIPIDTLIVNPDNLLSSLSGQYQFLPEAYNPKTCLGGYYRGLWNIFEKADDNGRTTYDWSHLENKLLWCAERHTRLTIRIAQFCGYPYDKTLLTLPHNYKNNEADYDIFLKSQGFEVDCSGRLLLNGKYIKIGFPEKYFWRMVQEKAYPLITLQHDRDTCYVAFPNYNSDAFFRGWSDLLANLSKWLEKELISIDGTPFLVRGRPIKRKYLVEVMQAGFVGMYGEGWIKSSGVFPDDVRKVYRYADLYPRLFPNIPLSYPLAAYYDLKYYSLEGLRHVWSYGNSFGQSGLYYDVVGQENFHPYFDNGTIAKVLRELNFNNRRIGGEGSGLWRSEGLKDLLNHAYGAHFSGLALHNFAVTGERNTPLARKNWAEFKKLVGAQLYMSDVSFVHLKGRKYKMSFQLQNLGLCRVFSPYWEPFVVFRDKEGKELWRQRMSLNLNSVEPNSQSPEKAGIIRASKPYIMTIRIPSETYSVNFAIIDKYGVYENFWLHNYGRTDNGEYLLFTMPQNNRYEN